MLSSHSAAPHPCMRSLPPLLPGHLHLSRAQGAGSGLETVFPAPPGCRWLNTLGLLASQGIDVVVRHSFLDHGHNHLVDQNFNPLPVGLPGGTRKDAPFSLIVFFLGGGIWFFSSLRKEQCVAFVPDPSRRRLASPQRDPGHS